jgi:hypothetical protein
MQEKCKYAEPKENDRSGLYLMVLIIVVYTIISSFSESHYHAKYNEDIKILNSKLDSLLKK